MSEMKKTFNEMKNDLLAIVQEGVLMFMTQCRKLFKIGNLSKWGELNAKSDNKRAVSNRTSAVNILSLKLT